MKQRKVFWVRVDPVFWHDWDRTPREVRFGKIRTTEPPREEMNNWIKLVAEGDTQWFLPHAQGAGQ